MRDTDVVPTILCPDYMHLSELMEVSRFWIEAGICGLNVTDADMQKAGLYCQLIGDCGARFHKIQNCAVGRKKSTKTAHICDCYHSLQISKQNPNAPEFWPALLGRSILLQLCSPECFD